MVFFIEISEKKIDFDSNSDQPTATFILKSDKKISELLKCCCNSCCCNNYCTSLHVKYRAIVKDGIFHVTEKVFARLYKNDTFSIQIPKNTLGLEITVTVPNGKESKTKLIEYFPSDCKSDFIASHISTRLTMKICNSIAIDTSGLDHTAVNPDEDRIFGHQLGPGRASRALAIVHIAMFEALNAILKRYESYLNYSTNINNASIEAAIIQAMYDTLTALFPSHQPRLLTIYNNLMLQITNSNSKNNGKVIGSDVAKLILDLRSNDNSNHVEQVVGVDYIPSDAPGEWRPDPISGINIALGSNWSSVTPFVITSADAFRCPPLPSLTSDEYMMAFDEVKSVGGDGINTVTTRSEELAKVGIFWAYDGTPSLCAPPRLYNQVVIQVADQHFIDTIELCHLLVMVNVSMADAGITCWDSKYFYKFWRPVTGIREADIGTGPSMLGDGNPQTVGDINWSPLGAPASNISNGINFTPPFPAYPSGHGTFGGALFQCLRYAYGTDNIPFRFVSDEFNGITVDNQGNVRPYEPRYFNSFSQAAEENGQSRMYLGIHWNFDKIEGITMGNNVANYVYDNIYKPL